MLSHTNTRAAIGGVLESAQNQTAQKVDGHPFGWDLGLSSARGLELAAAEAAELDIPRAEDRLVERISTLSAPILRVASRPADACAS